MIGTELVAKSAPDGYTILVVSFPFSVMNALYPASKVDVVKDFAALNYVGYAPSLLVANSATPYKSVGELIEAARARPATLLYASTSNGSSAHLFMELFKSLTKTSLVHVPYKGNGPAMVDLLGGHVPIMFANLPNGLPHVQAGKLRALAVTAPKRIDVLPDVQTMGEAGVNGFEANTWWGAVAPAATPKDVLAKLNAEINRILGDRRSAQIISKPGRADCRRHHGCVRRLHQKPGRAVEQGRARSENKSRIAAATYGWPPEEELCDIY